MLFHCISALMVETLVLFLDQFSNYRKQKYKFLVLGAQAMNTEKLTRTLQASVFLSVKWDHSLRSEPT